MVNHKVYFLNFTNLFYNVSYTTVVNILQFPFLFNVMYNSLLILQPIIIYLQKMVFLPTSQRRLNRDIKLQRLPLHFHLGSLCPSIQCLYACAINNVWECFLIHRKYNPCFHVLKHCKYSYSTFTTKMLHRDSFLHLRCFKIFCLTYTVKGVFIQL